MILTKTNVMSYQLLLRTCYVVFTNTENMLYGIH